MGHQMSETLRDLVTIAIQSANPRPEDIADCLDLLIKKKILTMKKVKTLHDELSEVCLKAIDPPPPSPPTSATSPPSPVDPEPDQLHVDQALFAAAQNSRDKEESRVHLSVKGDFKFANAKFTQDDFSYIREWTVKDLGLECEDGIVEIRWNDPNLPADADRVARTTVLVYVSEEAASRVGMNFDILFGKHCRDLRDVQRQAVSPLVEVESESEPSPSEVRRDESCASSVAESASPNSRVLAPLPPQSSHDVPMIFWGSEAGRQLAMYQATLEAERARRSGAFGP